MADSDNKIAILYQAISPPVIDGIRKPMKPGGYSDSGADIAYVLKENASYQIITPVNNPDPHQDKEWVFPDTEEGIKAAFNAGANILWANTILFADHPLAKIKSGDIRIVGQNPSHVQKHDDKWVTNNLLRSAGMPVPKAFLVSIDPAEGALQIRNLTERDIADQGLSFPCVIKPVRGRGSQGVVKVSSLDELKQKATSLLNETVDTEGQSWSKYGEHYIVEQYLPGQEVTLTIMPPGVYEIDGEEKHMLRHWSLPLVERFNHENGVAPYNGVVAVVQNSRLLGAEEVSRKKYQRLQAHCEAAAEEIGATAPIRIDCRASEDGSFYLFDLNMKPNMTGPGRPGRDNQDSLSAIAARGINWDYQALLVNMARQARPSSIQPL